MKLTYFGHSCFGLEAPGVNLIMDPYLSGAFQNRFRYRPIPGTWDIALVSHEHDDHNHIAASFGKPAVVRGPAEHLGVKVQCFPGRHGDAGGRVQEQVRIFRFGMGGLTFVHPGDLGKPLGASLAGNLRPVDVLFLPVGGTFTAGPQEALELIEELQPRYAVPMHYLLPAADLTILPLSEFLKVNPWPVKKLDDSSLDLAPETLPARTTVLLLKPECA